MIAGIIRGCALGVSASMGHHSASDEEVRCPGECRNKWACMILSVGYLYPTPFVSPLDLFFQSMHAGALRIRIRAAERILHAGDRATGLSMIGCMKNYNFCVVYLA